MDTPTSSALQNIRTLSSPAKTSLIDSIAQEMTTTIITISKEIQRGTLKSHHTAPLDHFIRTIQQNETAQQRKLERKLTRYQRRVRRWRTERQWIRREFAETVRQMEILHQYWKMRIEVLEKDSCSASHSDSGSRPGQYGESSSAQ